MVGAFRGIHGHEQIILDPLALEDVVVDAADADVVVLVIEDWELGRQHWPGFTVVPAHLKPRFQRFAGGEDLLVEFEEQLRVFWTEPFAHVLAQRFFFRCVIKFLKRPVDHDQARFRVFHVHQRRAVIGDGAHLILAAAERVLGPHEMGNFANRPRHANRFAIFVPHRLTF